MNDWLFDTQSGAFTFGLFVQIRERGDVVKRQLSPRFSSVSCTWGKKTDNQVVEHVPPPTTTTSSSSSSSSLRSLIALSLQLTAPKSRVWPDLDSSLYQVTQHPTSLHPSIVSRPTQPLLPFISLAAGFISDRRSVSEAGPMRLTVSPSTRHELTHHTNIFTPLFLSHNCLFIPSSVSSLRSSICFPPSVDGTLSACLCGFCCTAHRNTKAFVGLPPLWCGEIETHKDKLELRGAGFEKVTARSEITAQHEKAGAELVGRGPDTDVNSCLPGHLSWSVRLHESQYINCLVYLQCLEFPSVKWLLACVPQRVLLAVCGAVAAVARGWAS